MKRSLLILVALGTVTLLFVNHTLIAQVPRSADGASEKEIRKLVEELDRGRAAWINGRPESSGTRYMVQASDMFVFPPFGGTAPESGAGLLQAQRRTAAQFKGGSGKIELVKAMSSGDLLVLVLIERNEVNFAGRAAPHPWILRTTQVFRRDGDRWVRLHRHADPLVRQRSLDETLALY
jgi:ketosteroid isomerase-like protein